MDICFGKFARRFEMTIKILWLCAAVSSIFGAFVVLDGSTSAETVFQAIQATSSGIALAVIPYCTMRAIDEAAKKGTE